jgi:hypothetical protein
VEVSVRSLLLVALMVSGCSGVVRNEGFRATVSQAQDRALNGRFESSGGASCGVVGPRGTELRLVGDAVTVSVDEPAGRPDARVVRLAAGAERYTTERPGGISQLYLQTPGGRLIGSLSAHLVHESAGSTVDGRPAAVRELDLEVTFNLQPCL